VLGGKIIMSESEEEIKTVDGEGTTNVEVPKLKIPKRRSPNYPAIGLEKALERAQTLQEHARHHFMPVTVAHSLWNYKKGAGDQIVAALRSFGLLEVQGEKESRQVRITKEAQRILGNAPDREGLLKAAALKPDLHKEIWEKYEGDLPADAIIREYLRWERNFNEDFVDSFIAQFRGTIAYAKLTLSDKIRTDNGEDEEEDEGEDLSLFDTPKVSTPRGKLPPPPPPVPSGFKDFPLYLLTSSLKGTLQVPEEMSLKDYKLLKQQIDNHMAIIRLTSVVSDNEEKEEDEPEE
jgi:hypothetical protein